MTAACNPVPRRFAFDVGAAPTAAAGIVVRFFSVGCFLVESGGTALLTDPFFSHLKLKRVVHGPVVPDPPQVEPYLPLMGNVEAAVVGHAHYDHLLDLPAVAPAFAPRARIFGSTTMAHTFAPTGLSREVVVVNDRVGQWLEAGALRVLPIASGHPDNVPGIHLFQKRLTEPRTEPPIKASDYQEGDTFAYLVDFPEHRVYVQTSSRGYPDGFFDPAILAERPVDVALLAMDCANIQARGRGPSIIDFLAPRHVVFCHWGDFFRGKDEPRWEGVKVDLPRLTRNLPSTDRTTYTFPAWDSVHAF